MAASDNSKALERTGLVWDIKRISLPTKLVEKLGEEHGKRARQNSRHIFAYRFMYRSRGYAIKGFLIEPRTGSDLPCVIANRGGSADFGAVKLGSIFAGPPGELARAGYAVIMSQYTGGPGSEGAEEWGSEGNLADVLYLRKILKAYSRADAERIGMYGASRGGMMTYLALKKVRWLRAAATVAGAADLFRGKEDRPEMYQKVYTPYFGGTKDGMWERSAVCWADTFASKTPLLLMHGTADWRVNVKETLDLAEKLYEYKKPYRLIVFEGADHALTGFEAERNRQLIAWFDRFVKNGETPPSLRPRGK